jgi:tetratricopeptide (TPR) repeat protein
VRTLDAALTRQPLRTLPDYQRPYFDVATLYALAGRADRARAVLAEYDADLSDSLLRRSWEPQLHNARAEIALAEHRPLDALKEFRLGDRLPDGPANQCRECFSALQGRAFDQANVPDSTIAMYEAFLAVPRTFRQGDLSDATYLAGIEKRLGELYEAKGERAKATQHYAHFVELWKNADAELQPKVADVRRRLERLEKAEK